MGVAKSRPVYINIYYHIHCKQYIYFNKWTDECPRAQHSAENGSVVSCVDKHVLKSKIVKFKKGSCVSSLEISFGEVLYLKSSPSSSFKSYNVHLASQMWRVAGSSWPNDTMGQRCVFGY